MQRCTTGNIAHGCGWRTNIVQGAVKCYACLETMPTCTISRRSHIRITCRSVCDRDQNGIKLSMFLFGADQGIKTNSEQLISTDQSISLDSTEAWLHFVLWIPVKPSDQEPQNRVIEDDFHWSRFLIAVANTSMGDAYVTTPCLFANLHPVFIWMDSKVCGEAWKWG